MINRFIQIITKENRNFHPVVSFSPDTEKILKLDFTKNNRVLSSIDLTNTKIFTAFIEDQLQQANAVYGMGGYLENRFMYDRSKLFAGEENRTIHLGVDIWGKAGTPIFAPLKGSVHSFAFNNNFGDYGATIILQHQFEGIVLHTLYGHLSLADIEQIKVGQSVNAGQLIAHFGQPNENGNWPPHLHFQLIIDMENKNGDYPGVCAINELDKYKSNCPDPDLILKLMQYAQ